MAFVKLVGVSGTHLLKSFIDISKKDNEHVKWQIVINVVFLFCGFMCVMLLI